MPIYEQTYRNYQAEVRHSFRWTIIVSQELRILMKTKIFQMLLLAAAVHVVLRILQVTAYDVITRDPNNPLAGPLMSIKLFTVDETMFFNFIRIQAPLVFLASLYAGAGMICNDFRNNLMEVYFSKPISWVDYVLGKIMTLVLIGLGFTAVPGIFLVILHNMLVAKPALFYASYWWPFAIVGFSLAITLPAALATLACSALFGSQNYAAIAVFMTLMANSALGGTLAVVLPPKYGVISFPFAIERVGELFFRQRDIAHELSWALSLGFVAAVSLGALWIICRVVRRAEIAV